MPGSFHRYIEIFRSTHAEIRPVIHRGGGRPSPYDRPGGRGFGGGYGGKYGSGYERQYRGRGKKLFLVNRPLSPL